MDNDSFINLGGSVEKALIGEYNLNVKAIIQEAWTKTKQNRKSINLGLMFCLFFGVNLSFLCALWLDVESFQQITQDQEAFMLINLVVNIALAPFLAGIEMIAIFHAVNITTAPKLVFAFLQRSSWIVMATFMSSLLVSLGEQLFVLPGIYLLVALSLVFPLVIEKRLSPIQAIILSLKATRFQWLKMFLLYSGLLLAFIVIALPLALFASTGMGVIGLVLFIFGLSYLAPMYYHVKGIIYREMFGMKIKRSTSQQTTYSDDIFSA